MTPAPTRHFLGWDQPVLHAAADWLTRHADGSPVDLSSWLVIVPTRHAGRRLREHLAQRFAESGGVVPPRVGTPQSLVAMGAKGRPIADSQFLTAAWVHVLKALVPDAFPRLFPGGTRPGDLAWAFSCAQRFMSVQHLLGERGLTIRGLATDPSSAPFLQETDRWEELAALEMKVVAVLDKAGLEQPAVAKAAVVKQLAPPDGVEQVALLAVPDPIPLAIEALTTLQSQLPVHVVVHAPASLGAGFDEWGRPQEAFWSRRRFPVADRDISLVAGPDEMAAETLETMTLHGAHASDVVIGVPDPAVIPFIEKVFKDASLATHDPAGLPLHNHPVVALLERMTQLKESGPFASLAALFRHPDYLRLLRHELGSLPERRLLMELDAFQNEFLPSDSVAVIKLASGRAASSYPVLARAVDALKGHLAALDQGPFGKSLLQFLARTYTARELHLERPEDRAFQAVAKAVSDLLYALDQPVYDHLDLTPNERFSLLRHSLANLSYYLERNPEAVDLLGWLELHWDDAPLVIVTGMNDGRVPESVVGDAFVPDALRQQLGLACNASRFARDAYLAQALLAGRAEGVATGCRFIVGRANANGDPLRPSRLLFLCDDELLSARVQRLFHEVPAPKSVTVSPEPWPLRPPAGPLPTHLSVTALRDYLACPFRFYLKWVLGMTSVDDRANELDPMQFGILCHDALEELGRSDELAESTDADDLAAFLDRTLTRKIARWFGSNLPVAVQVQVEAARQRLLWAAQVEARERRDGWRIQTVERNLGTQPGDTLGGFPLRGRMDRLDRHTDGRWRVLDYKTRETSKTPFESHLRRARPDAPDWQRVTIDDKEHEWSDLQLPLYAHFAAQSTGSPVAAGIFELPGAVSNTAVTMFAELTPELIDHAVACATAAADAIADWQFWPPRSVKWDDYAGLLGDDPVGRVDVDAFLAMLDSRRKEGV